MRGNYFWGGPFNNRAREQAWQKLIEGRDASSISVMLTSYLNRVTDKTAAVLTLAGLVFAVSLFVMERSFNLFVAISGVSSTGGIFLLALNLGTVWRKDQSNWNPDIAYLRDLFFLFARRAVRLQVALSLIGIAALFSCLALIKSELPPTIWGDVEAQLRATVDVASSLFVRQH